MLDPNAPLPSMRITPEGSALARAFADAAAGRTSLEKVAAVGSKIFFQFTQDALTRRSANDTPSSTDSLDSVLGPYCNRCRFAVTATSFSEWTTSERREEALPASCSKCGASFDEAGISSAALRAEADRTLRRLRT